MWSQIALISALFAAPAPLNAQWSLPGDGPSEAKAGPDAAKEISPASQVAPGALAEVSSLAELALAGEVEPAPEPTLDLTETAWIENPQKHIWYGVTRTGTWQEAQQEAESWGGHLVTIANMTDLDWLRETFGRERLWIGLHDSNRDGRFQWSSGAQVDFRFWAWARPDNLGKGESFVYMNHNVFGEWNDGGEPQFPNLSLRGIVELPHPPGDFDADGLSDDLEKVLGIDPTDIDSDDDGISDRDEYRGFGNEHWVTDPNSWDTDGDGLSDGQETGFAEGLEGDAYRNILGTNLSIFRPDQDPASYTDPTAADTDIDGAGDGAEDFNQNGRLDPGENDPLDPGDQGLKVRANSWIAGRTAQMEVLGAEPGARLGVYLSQDGVRFGDIEAGGWDVLAGEIRPLAFATADAGGAAHWVYPLKADSPTLDSAWIQVVEWGTEGTWRISPPVAIASRSGRP
jgi:lectin-like protein